MAHDGTAKFERIRKSVTSWSLTIVAVGSAVTALYYVFQLAVTNVPMLILMPSGVLVFLVVSNLISQRVLAQTVSFGPILIYGIIGLMNLMLVMVSINIAIATDAQREIMQRVQDDAEVHLKNLDPKAKDERARLEQTISDAKRAVDSLQIDVPSLVGNFIVILTLFVFVFMFVRLVTGPIQGLEGRVAALEDRQEKLQK